MKDLTPRFGEQRLSQSLLSEDLGELRQWLVLVVQLGAHVCLWTFLFLLILLLTLAP